MKAFNYIFMLFVLSLVACTSTPNGDAPPADQNHVANFVSSHMIDARADIGSCKTCHGADYRGGTVGVDCLSCHLSGLPFTIHTASWANARDGHQTFGNDFSWTNCANAACHGADLKGGALNSTVTGPSCFSDSTASGSCHLAGPPAPTAANSDFVHTGTYTDPVNHGLAAKANQEKCLNCHGRPTNTFDGGFVADAAILNNADANCANTSCHPAATAHPTEWQGSTDDIDATYDSTHRAVSTSTIAASCALCHLTTAAGTSPMAAAPSCYSSTFTNANTTVSSCHADGPGPFHTTSHFAWDGTCANCHSGANIVVDVHNATCSLCHTSVNGGDARIKGTDGDATSATTATACTGCHSNGTSGAITRAFIHHDTANAQSGTCTYCHADPRPGWETTYGVTRPATGIPQVLACVKCHVEVTGTGLVVYKNTYTPHDVTALSAADNIWGATGEATVAQATVHSFTAAAKINVKNYGACLGCHASGYVSEITAATAPPIQVWHAKPTWNKATVDDPALGDDDDASETKDNPFEVLRSAPGRSYYANDNTPLNDGTDTSADVRRFNIFAMGENTGIDDANSNQVKLRMRDRYTFNDAEKLYKNTNSQGRGDSLYSNYDDNAKNPWASNVWSNRVIIPMINAINNGQGLVSASPSVPHCDNGGPGCP